MVRLAAELLLLLGLLLLTLHITVLRSSPLQHGNDTVSAEQDSQVAENNVNAESSSSVQLGPGGRQSRVSHSPASKPWAHSHGTGGSLQRDGPGAFLLDLQNFPDLSKADINGQNPNIQVTIEVVDSLEGSEPEKGIRKENKPGWAAPNWRNWWLHSSSSSASSSSVSTPKGPDEQDYPYESNTEDSNFLKPLGDWGRRGAAGTASRTQAEYDYIDGEGDWSGWSPCSVTCGNGNQKRTRSCGYACTATESRTCDMPSCPGIEDAFKTAATEVSLLAGTEEFNATELFGVDTDSCERWMNCKSEFLKKYMSKVASDLPSCPCSYPTEVAYSTADVHDPTTRHNFRWKDASGPKEKLEIYKPTARYCIRSMLTLESTTLAAQHCCYDDSMKLITRGKGAGTPNLISTEFSADLHYKVDILPWIICKGDWSRYNQARTPNNGQKCAENPQDEDYYKQFEEAREF
ncbi:isthmin-1 [Myxocyprinus asiaticus]|uniref:isthmin-1 n=1 Tax=Myxocyprinus asiaticus TaxID=70543 RepID=UPI002221EC57|nr:isthmin-1 [Myxocyprinus asiaticus]